VRASVTVAAVRSRAAHLATTRRRVGSSETGSDEEGRTRASRQAWDFRQRGWEGRRADRGGACSFEAVRGAEAVPDIGIPVEWSDEVRR